MDYQKVLKDLTPQKDFFIGIDSDGCVFDTMELKQKEFFIPNGIKYFGLFAISKIVRETWEFVNLYSVHRGVNRFPALVKVFELLAERDEIKKRNFKLPDIEPLKEWIASESKLGNPALRAYFEENQVKALEPVLQWTEAINEEIASWLKGVSPFLHARECLDKIHAGADSIVVSQTPVDALEREWKEHDIEKYVRLIAGQEYGTKSEHLALAAVSKYSENRILMIGDAPGDLKAATSNGVCFYPVIPGRESDSWKRLSEEGLDRFFNDNYKGKYEDELLAEFRSALPDTPPWK